MFSGDTFEMQDFSIEINININYTISNIKLINTLQKLLSIKSMITQDIIEKAYYEQLMPKHYIDVKN